MNRRHTLKLATAVLLFATATPSASASDWLWTVTPYAWVTDVGIDVSVDDQPRISEVISAEELLEDLETIVQVRIEAQNGAHGLFADLFDVTLADDAAEIPLPGGAGSATLTPEMGMTLAEFGGLYDHGGDGRGLQLLYGVRLLNERAEIDAVFRRTDGTTTATTYEIDDTLVDGLVGLRYIRPFGKRWALEAKADVSAGGTELTWSAGPTLRYTFGKSGRYIATAGYRHMEVDFDTAENVDATMTLEGFVAGLRISF